MGPTAFQPTNKLTDQLQGKEKLIETKHLEEPSTFASSFWNAATK